MGHGTAPQLSASHHMEGALVAASKKKWSRRVTQTSDALTLEEGVFARRNPRSIARSLKRSADRSTRRKADPYRSAMSMLTFYVNRAGKNMPASRKRILEKAKDELRRLYGKQAPARAAQKRRTTSTKQRRTSGTKRRGGKKSAKK